MIRQTIYVNLALTFLRIFALDVFGNFWDDIHVMKREKYANNINVSAKSCLFSRWILLQLYKTIHFILSCIYSLSPLFSSNTEIVIATYFVQRRQLDYFRLYRSISCALDIASFVHFWPSSWYLLFSIVLFALHTEIDMIKRSFHCYRRCISGIWL